MVTRSSCDYDWIQIKIKQCPYRGSVCCNFKGETNDADAIRPWRYISTSSVDQLGHSLICQFMDDSMNIQDTLNNIQCSQTQCLVFFFKISQTFSWTILRRLTKTFLNESNYYLSGKCPSPKHFLQNLSVTLPSHLKLVYLVISCSNVTRSKSYNFKVIKIIIKLHV